MLWLPVHFCQCAWVISETYKEKLLLLLVHVYVMQSCQVDGNVKYSLFCLNLKIYSKVQGMYNLLEVWVVKVHKKAAF